MPDYVYSIILVVVLILIFSWWSMKKKKEEWEGTLVKKKYTMGDENSQDQYILIFKTTAGRKKRFSLYSRSAWDEWNEGEKAIKSAGKYFPEKLHSGPAQN